MDDIDRVPDFEFCLELSQMGWTRKTLFSWATEVVTLKGIEDIIEVEGDIVFHPYKRKLILSKDIDHYVMGKQFDFGEKVYMFECAAPTCDELGEVLQVDQFSFFKSSGGWQCDLNCDAGEEYVSWDKKEANIRAKVVIDQVKCNFLKKEALSDHS